VNRPAIDPGLWALCTAVPLVLFATLPVLEVVRRGLTTPAVLNLGGAVLGSLVAGVVVYDRLSARGWRVSRPKPDQEQAEDYGDGP
jgi:hypothetical protein